MTFREQREEARAAARAARPTRTTCQGCGDPDVPVGPKGAIPKWCDGCAAYPRNKAHAGWSPSMLAEERARRRAMREHAEDWTSGESTHTGEDPDDAQAQAELVAEDQEQAERYWREQGAPVAEVQRPDGPVVLNQPVDYDPDDDELLKGFENDPPVAVEDLGVHDGPVELVADDPDLVDHPDSHAPACVAPDCALPDPGHGHDLFCRGHWRLVSHDTRQRVLGAPKGSARNAAVHRALFEIRRALGG